MTPEEIIKQAKQAKSVEELMVFVKENDIDLSEEEVKKHFDIFHAEGELADEELENAAGGGACDKEPTHCPICGSDSGYWNGYEWVCRFNKCFCTTKIYGNGETGWVASPYDDRGWVEDINGNRVNIR